jgi:hypothetical protein
MAISAATALAGAGAASDLIGGFTGNKQKAMPGQQTRPMADSLKDIDKLRAWLDQNMQYIQRPTRRLTAPELEGPFAPVAVREIQNYFDYKYPNRGDMETQTQESKPASAPTIMSYSPPAQKGGAPGFYMMSDGTKVLEQNFDPSLLEDFDKHYGVMPQGNMVGMKYGSAPTSQPQQQTGLTEQELQMLRTMMMGAQSGNR